MSPRKLTEDDKQEILQLYRSSKATTSTLATQYEVSSSTISRFLKNKLSESEYEDLIQQKRLARTPRGEAAAVSNTQPTGSSDKANEPVLEPIAEVEATTDSEPAASTSTRRRRRRSIAIAETTELQIDTPKAESKNLAAPPEPESATTPEKKTIVSSKSSDRPTLKQRVEPINEEDTKRVEVLTLQAMFGEDMLGEDIDEDDDEDDDDEWEEGDDEITYPQADKIDVKIMPLSAASLPRTCYLVIDRSAELIVKPLKDFADLGLIPETEVKQKTLPIFDNHRIAKRFSHRRERVIKVPDSRILYKTSHYLEAKGITRLLVDGKIYSLSVEVEKI
jgi:transposase-like protein